MTLLLCAATARELAGLAPGFAPPGLPPLAVAPAGATDDPWPEMRLWPLPLRRGRALCCLTGVGPLNAALALGLALERARAEGYARERCVQRWSGRGLQPGGSAPPFALSGA